MLAGDFATRPLMDSANGLGNLIQSAVDPVSGLSNQELPIQLGDCIILAAASDLPVPAVPDQIIMDGETWSVVDSAPVAPGDTALVHNILIRRG